MNQEKYDKFILWLSLPLAVVVITISLVGLTTPGFYAAETANWQAQSIGQDMADLFLAIPALLLSAFFAYHKRKGAILVWAGVVAYLLYTFIIYCFAVHFNSLFIFYCLALGLSFYSMLWFFFLQFRQPMQKENYKNVPRKLVGSYLILLSLLFYFLWLSEIIPAIMQNETPKTVKETGLLTNAVHVIDLSVFLPGMFITGFLILKKKLLGFIMTPVLLSFFVLMDITIGGLIIVMRERGMEGSYTLSAIMGGLAILSALLLIVYIRRMNKSNIISY